MYLMNSVLRPYLDKFVIVFIDDILVYSENEEEHIKHLAAVLRLLREHQLYAKLNECSFFQTEVHYLGHVVSKEGIAIDLEKIRAIMEWVAPKSVDKRKGKKFEWTGECEASFEKLKQLLTHAPVLQITYSSKELVVCTDSCKRGLGGVLMQVRQARWLVAINEFDFKIKYIKGKENKVVDALSRQIQVHHLAVMSSYGMDLQDRILQAGQQDVRYMENVHRLQQGDSTGTSHGIGTCTCAGIGTCSGIGTGVSTSTCTGAQSMDYRLTTDGLVRFRDRIYVSDSSDLKKVILREFHVKPYSECKHLGGLLQWIVVPKWKWEFISMDFITGLSKILKQHDSIMVIVDRLTKVAHLIPMKSMFSTSDVAQVFIRDVVRLHSVPKNIVSNKDAKFTSKFWELISGLGTELTFITAYHLQTDGKIERVNRLLEDKLRMYVMHHQMKWEEYLPLVEFAYNNGYQKSLRMSPFEASYGRSCNTPISWSDLVSRVIIGPNMLANMEQEMQVIKKNIKTAQNRHKSYVDRNRLFKEFQVGENEYMHIKPKKISLRVGSCAKLAPWFCKPFSIIERTGLVAYRLALPPTVKVHDFFHVYLLKKYVKYVDNVIN
eukprot:PITA_30645